MTTAWTLFESPQARCDACQCFVSSKVHALRGEGPTRADIALIGEAPGEQEEELEANFQGRAGEMLDGCIAEAGIESGLSRSDYFICNAVRCRPVNKAGKNRKPSMTEIDACRGYTIDELRTVKPKVIVTLGDVPMTSLIGKQTGGVTQHRGRVKWSDDFNAWIVSTFHPAYALRQYDKRHWIVEDLKLAARVLRDGKPPEIQPTTVEIIESVEQARAMRDHVLGGAYSEFAFDWETNGVHLTKSLGFVMSLAVREGHAYVIPRYGSGFMPCWSRAEFHEIDNVLRSLLLSDLIKIGFHLAFDNCVSKTTLGVWPKMVPGSFCGMIGHHCYANHLGPDAHSLKVCADSYLGMGRYDDELDQWLLDAGYTYNGKPDMGRVWLAPDALVRKYNGADSDATLRFKRFLLPKIIEAGLERLFWDERMPMVFEHQEIDRAGVRINMPYLDQLSLQLGDALHAIEAQLEEIAGHPVNPASYPQVGKLLFEEIGLPITARTETGQPSTKEEVLFPLKDASPAVPLILAHRIHSKIKGTYVDGKDTEAGRKKALRAVVDDDGYARMNTHIGRLVTHRLATSKPFAIHTFPKTDPKKGVPPVRALIIPDDGYDLVSTDYVQQEFVIQAIGAGQEDMVIAILDRGEDAHEMVTRDLGGVAKSQYLWKPDSLIAIPPADHYVDPEKSSVIWLNRTAYDTYKKERQRWKSVNFMIMYRGGAAKLARMALGCTGSVKAGTICKIDGVMDCGCYQKAAAYIQQYYEKFEAIQWWQYNIIKQLKQTGMVRGFFDAYRKIPAIFDSNFFMQLEAERQACNFPIQEGGARVMFRALLRTCARFRGKLPLRAPFPGRVLFTVHDELTAQVRHDLVAEGVYIIKTCMEAPYPELGGRSLRTDTVVGSCWGG